MEIYILLSFCSLTSHKSILPYISRPVHPNSPKPKGVPFSYPRVPVLMSLIFTPSHWDNHLLVLIIPKSFIATHRLHITIRRMFSCEVQVQKFHLKCCLESTDNLQIICSLIVQNHDKRFENKKIREMLYNLRVLRSVLGFLFFPHEMTHCLALIEHNQMLPDLHLLNVE